MENIEELKNKLQCQNCHKPYSGAGYLHNECKHHSCGRCIKWYLVLDAYECPICHCSTKITPILFLKEMLDTLKNCEYSFKKYDAAETDLRTQNLFLKEKGNELEALREHHHKCVECEKSDSEQDMQLCATCHGLEFGSHEDVKNNALCSTCAIKKHIRQGHQIVDFYPHLSAYNFSSHLSEVDEKTKDFKSAQVSLGNTFSHFKNLSTNVSENFDVLTDMARRSKDTKTQVEFIEKMETFIDDSKSINIRADSDMKKHATEMEGNLARIKEWYESKMGNCVDESEIIKIPKPEDSNGDVIDVDA